MRARPASPLASSERFSQCTAILPEDPHGPEAQSIHTYSSATVASCEPAVHICGCGIARELGIVVGQSKNARSCLRVGQVVCRSLPMFFLVASVSQRNTVQGSIAWGRPGCSGASSPQTLYLRRQHRHHWTGPKFCGKHAGRSYLGSTKGCECMTWTRTDLLQSFSWSTPGPGADTKLGSPVRVVGRCGWDSKHCYAESRAPVNAWK